MLLASVCVDFHPSGIKVKFPQETGCKWVQCDLPFVKSCDQKTCKLILGLVCLPPRSCCLAQRRYFRSRSLCHMYFLSGNLSGILILRKSWMHFSSSSSTVIFSFAGLFLQLLVSRELAVSVRSKSLFRLWSDCWIMGMGPFFSGLSRVWTLAWGWDWRLTGPQITVPWGELASDWLSELEVERSLKEVPLSPSPSPLWFLQQQSHGGEDQRDGPPAKTQNKRGS